MPSQQLPMFPRHWNCTKISFVHLKMFFQVETNKILAQLRLRDEEDWLNNSLNPDRCRLAADSWWIWSDDLRSLPPGGSMLCCRTESTCAQKSVHLEMSCKSPVYPNLCWMCSVSATAVTSCILSSNITKISTVHLEFIGCVPPLPDWNHGQLWLKPMCVFLQVWPGLTAYPDFSSDLTHEWWYDNLKRYHDKVPFDGVWIVSMSG